MPSAASGGVRGPLHGIPVLVKDNYETIEMPTTAGSIALASFHPARDAFLVQRLKAAGAVILGKTNMHELAAGHHHGRLALRADEEPLRSRSQSRRVERRHRRRGRRELRRRRHGQRHLRIDPHSGVAQQSRRPARHAGAVEPHRHRAALEHAGHRRADRAHASPISRSCSTRRSAPIRPTRRRRRAPGTFPRRIARGLRADALKGARIGVVRSLFGTAPEDQEVTTVVQQALDGAEEGRRRGHRRRHSRASTICCATAR